MPVPEATGAVAVSETRGGCAARPPSTTRLLNVGPSSATLYSVVCDAVAVVSRLVLGPSGLANKLYVTSSTARPVKRYSTGFGDAAEDARMVRGRTPR
jgi:hypothetical protein